MLRLLRVAGLLRRLLRRLTVRRLRRLAVQRLAGLSLLGLLGLLAVLLLLPLLLALALRGWLAVLLLWLLRGRVATRAGRSTVRRLTRGRLPVLGLVLCGRVRLLGRRLRGLRGLLHLHRLDHGGRWWRGCPPLPLLGLRRCLLRRRWCGLATQLGCAEDHRSVT
ncbi:hypothetical protein [Actinomadura xylanilytica]|uniref:hypothetical protein n=1 Tax=Actinomadura xylanilytica TaxID=887459 RepID=UPI00255B1DD3|nr:hypothetical protein [Actinomadura xylanilytica]